MKKQILSLALALIMGLALLPSSVFAVNTSLVGTYDDVPQSHWAYDAITRWSADEAAILRGYGNGKFGPDDILKAVELEIIIARLRGKESPKWGTSEAITREFAAKSLATALGLEPADTPDVPYADDALIDEEYRPYVYALKNAGMQQGVEGNRFEPKSSFTRAQTVQTAYNAISVIADSDISGKTYDKDVIIRKPGITISDTDIKGDLIIAEGVGDGDVWLKNVSIDGNICVNAGGENSVHFLNVTAGGKVYADRADGVLRIVVEGSANVNIEIRDSVIVVTNKLDTGATVRATLPEHLATGAKVVPEGAFTQITNNKPGSEFTLNGSVNTLTLNKPAQVSGDADIKTADVADGAGKGTILPGAPGSVTGDGKNEIGASGTGVSGSGSGSGTGSGNTGGDGSGDGNTGENPRNRSQRHPLRTERNF
ncbi:MAG: S-layer homology domain-containing protein [Clostridiales Family XIII bacterium]|jgi:hypothetical protein|nr:S-layer homology domain-containing protein [Clostridiales Family XIII bacterium]